MAVTSAGICIYNRDRRSVLIGEDGTYRRLANRSDKEILLQVNYRKERGEDFRTIEHYGILNR